MSKTAETVYLICIFFLEFEDEGIHGEHMISHQELSIADHSLNEMQPSEQSWTIFFFFFFFIWLVHWKKWKFHLLYLNNRF